MLFLFLFIVKVWDCVYYVVFLALQNELSSMVFRDISSFAIKTIRSNSWWILWNLLFFAWFVVFYYHAFNLFVLNLVNCSDYSSSAPNVIRISNVYLCSSVKVDYSTILLVLLQLFHSFIETFKFIGLKLS